MSFGKTFQRLFEFETDTDGQIHLEGYSHVTIPHIYNIGSVKNHFLKTGGKFLDITDKSAQVKELMIRYLQTDAIMIHQLNADFDLADMAKIQEFITTDVKDLIEAADSIPLVLDGSQVDGTPFHIYIDDTFAPTGHKPMRSEFADIIRDTTIEPPKGKKGKGKKKEGKEGEDESFDKTKLRPRIHGKAVTRKKKLSLFQKLNALLKGKIPTSVFPPLQPQVLDSGYVKPTVAVPLELANILGSYTWMSVKSDHKQDLSTLNNNGLKRTESQCIAAMRGVMKDELSRYGDAAKGKGKIHYVLFQTKQGTTTVYVQPSTRMAFVHSTFTGSMVSLDMFKGTGSGIDLGALHKKLDLHRSIQLPSFFESNTVMIFDTLIDKTHPFTLFFNKSVGTQTYDVYYIDYDGVTIQGLDTIDYTFVGKTVTALLGEPSTVVIPPTKPMKKKKEIVPPKKKVVQMVQYISLYDGDAGETDFDIIKKKFPLDDTVQGLINIVLLDQDDRDSAMAWKFTAKKLKVHVDSGKTRFELGDIAPGDKGVQANSTKLLEDVIYIIEKRPEDFDDSLIEVPPEDQDDLTIDHDLGEDQVEDFEELEAHLELGDRINAK